MDNNMSWFPPVRFCAFPSTASRDFPSPCIGITVRTAVRQAFAVTAEGAAVPYGTNGPRPLVIDYPAVYLVVTLRFAN